MPVGEAGGISRLVMSLVVRAIPLSIWLYFPELYWLAVIVWLVLLSSLIVKTLQVLVRISVVW